MNTPETHAQSISAVYLACVMLGVVAVSCPATRSQAEPPLPTNVEAPYLLQQLGDIREGVRYAARRRLATLRPPPLDSLRAIFANGHETGTKRATALWVIHDLEADDISLLAKAVNDSDVEVRSAAVRALGFRKGRQGDEAVTVLVRIARSDAGLSLRLSAQESLDVLGALPLDFPLALLDHPDVAVRKKAVELIARTGDPGARANLFELLQRHGEDQEVRHSAIYKFLWLSEAACHPECLEQLLALKKDSDGEIRSAVIRAISRIRDPRAADTLQHLLQSDDESAEMREAALTALAGISAVTPDEMVALSKGDRSVALASLERFPGDPRAITIAAETYLNPAEAPDLRRTAGHALAKIGGLGEYFRNVAINPESDEALRLQAIENLGDTSAASTDQQAGAALNALLRDSRQSTRIRLAAFRAAAKLDSVTAELCWGMLSEHNAELGLAAANRIWAVAPTPETRERFRSLFRDGVGPAQVRSYIFGLGYDFTERERFAEDLVLALGDAQEEIGRTAARLLCPMAATDRVKAAFRSVLLTGNARERVRSAVALMLASCPSPPVMLEIGDLGAISVLFESSDDGVRGEAFEAIGAFGDERAIPRLARILGFSRSSDSSRAGAIRALSGLGTPACPLLVEALEGPDLAIRSEAVRALTDLAQSGELSDAAVRAIIAAIARGEGISWWPVRHLASWRDLRAVEPLIEGLTPNDEQTATFFNQTLVLITGVDFGHDKVAWRAWWKGEGSARYVQAAMPQVPDPTTQELLEAPQMVDTGGETLQAEVGFYRDSMPPNPPGLNSWMVTIKVRGISAAPPPSDLLVDRLWFREVGRIVEREPYPSSGAGHQGPEFLVLASAPHWMARTLSRGSGGVMTRPATEVFLRLRRRATGETFLLRSLEVVVSGSS